MGKHVSLEQLEEALSEWRPLRGHQTDSLSIIILAAQLHLKQLRSERDVQIFAYEQQLNRLALEAARQARNPDGTK